MGSNSSKKVGDQEKMADVDDELDNLEMQIRDQLENVLIFNFDLVHWSELDEPTADDLRGLDYLFMNIFRPFVYKYRGTTVHEILCRCRDFLVQVAWAGLNVPFPHATGAHFNAIANNVTTVYVNMFYAELRTEMIMLNHHSQLIQTIWKGAVTNPSHPICRRRLLREFEILIENQPPKN